MKPLSEFNHQSGIRAYFAKLYELERYMAMPDSPEKETEVYIRTRQLEGIARMNRATDEQTYFHYFKTIQHEQPIIHNQHPVYCQPYNSGSFQNAHRF